MSSRKSSAWTRSSSGAATRCPRVPNGSAGRRSRRPRSSKRSTRSASAPAGLSRCRRLRRAKSVAGALPAWRIPRPFSRPAQSSGCRSTARSRFRSAPSISARARTQRLPKWRPRHSSCRSSRSIFRRQIPTPCPTTRAPMRAGSPTWWARQSARRRTRCATSCWSTAQPCSASSARRLRSRKAAGWSSPAAHGATPR